jgi:DNA-binding SARP family transcriptional activator
MEVLLSPDLGDLTTSSESSSPDTLLEVGIRAIRQGNHSGGIAQFELVRERLPDDQKHFIAIIDAFIQSHSNHCQAQEALFMASRRFVEAESEYRRQLHAVEMLLPTSRGEASKPSAVEHYAQNAQSGLSVQMPQPPSNNAKRQQPLVPNQLTSSEGAALQGLYFTCFGHFEVMRSGQAIVLSRNRSGQAILRYLAAQPDCRASIDSLMGVLWPEDAAEVARRKLQIAVSAVRCSLNSNYPYAPGGGYILCRDQTYQLNPEVAIQIDVEEFLALWKAGRQSKGNEALAAYEKACELYTGPFLVEDTYADWSFIRREQLSQIYLSMCHTLAQLYLETGRYEDARKWVITVLKENRSDEAAHRQLIRIYAAEGRRSEALRQYHLCESLLAEDLRVQPMPETVNLFRTLLNSEYPPENRAKIERK